MFNLRKRTVIKVDILDLVIRDTLSQSDESENLHSIVFHFRKFTRSELNYEIYNKKLLTIVKVFK